MFLTVFFCVPFFAAASLACMSVINSKHQRNHHQVDPVHSVEGRRQPAVPMVWVPNNHLQRRLGSIFSLVEVCRQSATVRRPRPRWRWRRFETPRRTEPSEPRRRRQGRRFFDLLRLFGWNGSRHVDARDQNMVRPTRFPHRRNAAARSCCVQNS